MQGPGGMAAMHAATRADPDRRRSFRLGLDEGAERHDLEPARADLIERAFGEQRADAAPAEFLRDFGMRESDDPGLEAIGRERGVAVDDQFELVLFGVVENFHLISLSSCPPLWRASTPCFVEPS